MLFRSAEATSAFLEDFDLVSANTIRQSGTGGKSSYARDARMAGLIDRRDATRKWIADQYDSYLQVVKQGMDELQSIEDAGVRAILIWKYVKGYRWDVVAKKMGDNVTADSVKKRVERYITTQNTDQ